MNLISTSLDYFIAFDSDEKIISSKKVAPYKKVLKESKCVSKKEYKLASKMVSVEEMVDFIMLNINLSDSQKLKLLNDLKRDILLNKGLGIDRKVKKLIK